MTYCIPIEVAIAVNEGLKSTTHLVLDQGKLESALGRPVATFAGETMYPTVVERSAVLLEAVASAHAFFDGNKRTAWLCSMLYLRMHGTSIAPTSAEESGGVVLDLVNKVIDHKQAALWLGSRMRRENIVDPRVSAFELPF